MNYEKKYEKKYKEALERAQKMQENSNGMILKKWLWAVFPELKESEDERMLREIKRYIKEQGDKPTGLPNGTVPVSDMIAWLEKQGKEEYALKSFKDEDIRKFMQYIEKQAKAYEFNLPNRGYDIYAFAKDILIWLEKQGEKKPNSQMEKCSKCQFVYTGYCDGTCILENNEQKSVDKVEPKFEPQFKVGNWITDGYIYYKITEILDDRYIIESKYDKRGAILFEYENRYHLWTIEDAKDGDVLVTDFGENDSIVMYKSRCTIDTINVHCCLDNKFTRSNLGLYNAEDVKPATKNERDLLFQGMKEAGYEWDSDKKELKKIEVVSKESKDERIKEQLCEFLHDNMRYQDAQYFESWLEKLLEKQKD